MGEAGAASQAIAEAVRSMADGKGLICRTDPKHQERHGFIEPAEVMTFEEFQALVAATPRHWTRVV